MEIKNNKPLVSVIIPTYNSEKFILSAIDSVLNQTYTNIELIVVDGNSDDNTAKICKEFEGLIFKIQPGMGISEALNFGIKISRGDFVSFISSDDLWEREKIRKQIQYITNNPETQLIVCKARFFLENGCKIPSNFKKEFLEKDTVQYILETVLARKKLFEKAGCFDKAFSAGMEMDWFARLIDMGIQIPHIDETLVSKRVHQTNTALNTKNVLSQSVRAMHNSIKRKRKNE